jgi:hypothetical protein
VITEGITRHLTLINWFPSPLKRNPTVAKTSPTRHLSGAEIRRKSSSPRQNASKGSSQESSFESCNQRIGEPGIVPWTHASSIADPEGPFNAKPKNSRCPIGGGFDTKKVRVSLLAGIKLPSHQAPGRMGDPFSPESRPDFKRKLVRLVHRWSLTLAPAQAIAATSLHPASQNILGGV